MIKISKTKKRKNKQKTKSNKNNAIMNKNENNESKLKKFWKWGITFMFLFVFSLNFLCVEASCQEIQLDYYNMQFLDTSDNFKQKVHSYYSDGSVKFKKGIVDEWSSIGYLQTYNNFPINRDCIIFERYFTDYDLYARDNCSKDHWLSSYTIEVDASHESGEKSFLFLHCRTIIGSGNYEYGNVFKFEFGGVYRLNQQYLWGMNDVPFCVNRLNADKNSSRILHYTDTPNGSVITMRVGIGYLPHQDGNLCLAYYYHIFLNDELKYSSQNFFWFTSSHFKKITNLQSFTYGHSNIYLRDNEGFPNKFRLVTVNDRLDKTYGYNLIYKNEGRGILVPDAPDENVEDRPYWTYISNQLAEDEKETIFLEENISENQTMNYSADFSKLKVQSNERRYFYDPNTIKTDTLADWNTYMFGWSVSWNWLRDGIIAIVNLTLLAGQFVMYILTLALNTLFIWLILWIIVLVWNFPIYWVYYGLVGIIFYVIFALTWIWEILLAPVLTWVWDRLKIGWEWFMPNGMILIIDFYLLIVSYVLAAVLFCLGLGRVNYDILQTMIKSLLFELNHGIFEIMFVFIDNFVLFLSYTFVYIMLIGFAYIMMIYNKAKGYMRNATRLQSMINVYKIPFVIMIRLGAYIIGFINGGLPTDGADT